MSFMVPETVGEGGELISLHVALTLRCVSSLLKVRLHFGHCAFFLVPPNYWKPTMMTCRSNVHLGVGDHRVA